MYGMREENRRIQGEKSWSRGWRKRRDGRNEGRNGGRGAERGLRLRGSLGGR